MNALIATRQRPALRLLALAGSLVTAGALAQSSAPQAGSVAIGLLESPQPTPFSAAVARAELERFLPPRDEASPPRPASTARNDGLLRAARLMWTGRGIPDALLAEIEASGASVEHRSEPGAASPP